MAGWLLKSDPEDYSFADLLRERQTVWDGVSNPLARKYLRAMRRGDEALVYHTGDERAIVGVARVASDPYTVSGDGGEAAPVVELEALHPLARPVTLAEIKGNAAFADFELVRLPRLSVMPVPPQLWQAILDLAGR
ncbi:MAG: EVE domain-containing protein [Acidobacteriota bacterium]